MIQTTNIRRVLDRAMRHPMLRDIPLETAVEYAVDFITDLGVPSMYTEKTALINIKDWRGELPCDFESMIQVRNAPTRAFNGKGVMPGAIYRYDTGSFHLSPDKLPFAEYTYKTQGMCIYTSVKEAVIEIAYRAFAVDDEGFPLLPDNASFLNGLEAYLKYRWFTILFDMGKIAANVLANVKQDYATAFRCAQSELNKLDLDKAESLSNSLKMLLPRNFEHWRTFATNGTKEKQPIGASLYNRNSVYVVPFDINGESGGGDTPEPEPEPEPEPTPSTDLEYPLYYGGQATEVSLTDDPESIIDRWGHSSKKTTSGINCNQSWYYISLHSNYSIVSIITDNTEPITSLFELKGTYTHRGQPYKLYEFHLSSGEPLDVKMTLKVR